MVCIWFIFLVYIFGLYFLKNSLQNICHSYTYTIYPEYPQVLRRASVNNVRKS